MQLVLALLAVLWSSVASAAYIGGLESGFQQASNFRINLEDDDTVCDGGDAPCAGCGQSCNATNKVVHNADSDLVLTGLSANAKTIVAFATLVPAIDHVSTGSRWIGCSIVRNGMFAQAPSSCMGQSTGVGGAAITRCPFFFSEKYLNPGDRHAMRGMAVFENVEETDVTLELWCDINEVAKGAKFTTYLSAFVLRSTDDRVNLPAVFRYRACASGDSCGDFDQETMDSTDWVDISGANLNFVTHWASEPVMLCGATVLGTPDGINPGSGARRGQLRAVYCPGTGPCASPTPAGFPTFRVSGNLSGGGEDYHSFVFCTLDTIASAGTYHLELEKATNDADLKLAAYGQATLAAIPLRTVDGTSFDPMGTPDILGGGTTSAGLTAFYSVLFASTTYADPFRYLLFNTYTANPTSVGSGVRNFIGELWAESSGGPQGPILSITDFHNSGGPTDYLPGFLINHTDLIDVPAPALQAASARFATGDDPPNTDITDGYLAGFRLVPNQTSIPTITVTGTVTQTPTVTATPVSSFTSTPVNTSSPTATATRTSTPIVPYAACTDVTGPTPGVPDGICRIGFVGDTDAADLIPWLLKNNPEGDYSLVGPHICGFHAENFTSAQMADFLEASPGDCTGGTVHRGDDGPIDLWVLDMPHADFEYTRYAPRDGECFGGTNDGGACRVNLPEGALEGGINMKCVDGAEFGGVCSPGINNCTGDSFPLDPLLSLCKANVYGASDNVNITGCAAPGLCYRRIPVTVPEFNTIRMLNRIFTLKAQPLIAKPYMPAVWGADATRCAVEGCPVTPLPIGLGDVPIPTVAAPREHQYRAIAHFNHWVDEVTGKYVFGDPPIANGADIAIIDWEKMAQHVPVSFPVADNPKAHGQTWKALGTSSFSSTRGDGHCTCLVDADCGFTPTRTATATATRTHTATPTNTP